MSCAHQTELMFTFIVPGPIDQVTGGYIFDRRLVEAFRASGREVRVIELPGQFPLADEQARLSASDSLAALPDRALVVIDGLALPAFDEALAAHGSRLRVVGFVHHPLSLETGLDDVARDRMAAIEARLWSMLAGIVCPSRDSADAVARAGIPRTRIEVTPPGTDVSSIIGARLSVGEGRVLGDESPVRLLAVGTLVPRKAHALLLEALAELPSSLDWRLDCIGSLERSVATVEQVRALIRDRNLGGRVTLHGEVIESVRDQAYALADIFVLPSYHEGYGMVFAEAMAWGLPIIATTGGAIPETVPAEAGRLVTPGDRSALVAALSELISEKALRARMSSAARVAARSLPDWRVASTHWFNCVERLAR